jgi:hypothetical protein
MMLASFLLNQPITLPDPGSVTRDFVLQSLEHYLVGSTVLALAAGSFFGLATYLFLELTKKKNTEVSNQNLA